MAADRETLEKRIRQLKSLPTLPGVVQKICTMVESEATSMAEIGEIIATDQVLTARVLKIVNSPFYGFPGRISSINHALVLLGFNVVKGIMVSISVIDFMSDSIKGLWEHSLGVATAAGCVARGAGTKDPEEASTAGLLHDLGKVILSVELQRECDQVLSKARNSGILFIDAERRLLDGLTHCEIGGWLAEQWNMSPRLVEPIRRHHEPARAKSGQEVAAAVHVADILTRCLQYGSGGDPFVPELRPEALEILGLRLADLRPMLVETEEKLDAIDISDFAA